MYYIAILAPEEVNEKVLEWKKYMRDRFSCTIGLKSPAHITLIIPFWMNEETQNDLESKLLEFASTQQQFDICVKDFNCFEPRVIYVDVQASKELTELKTTLENLLSSKLFPIKKSGNAFHPHITIATRDLYKKDFNQAWDYFKNKHYQTVFPVHAVSLMKHTNGIWQPVFSAPLAKKT